MAYYRNYKKYTGKKADKNLTEDPKCYSYWLTKEKKTVTGLYINPSATLEYYKREIIKIVSKVLTVPNAFTKQYAYDNFVFNINNNFKFFSKFTAMTTNINCSYITFRIFQIRNFTIRID